MVASSSSFSSPPKEHDVFISFRGEDTRYNFISHLVSALSRKSIKAYIDNELKKGDEISSSLIKAINDSYGSLIIFSENYASSKWCLNELLQILECRKQGHFVIPVFFNTDPSDVRHQTASYGEAFAIHVRDSKNKEKLQSWKAALTETANIVGWDSQSPINRDESELIRNIVNDIVQKMNHIYQPSQSSYVGIDKYCEDIELLLQRSLLVGIWGMGGVGKTTIAKVIFGKLSSQFDSCCFFENVREESERNIRNKLLSELLKDDNFHSSTTESPTFKFAMRRLSSKKVLIVLDDANSSKQLKQLQQVCNCLGASSNIIITTRDKHVLLGLKIDPQIYEVKGLNFEKSLELFRLNAFNKTYLEIGYEEITKEVVDYAKGIPLALNVLGSFLLSKSKEEWESTLAKLKKIPNDDIQEKLRLSYDGLDYLDQQIFLEIACFLKGEYIEDVVSLLDSYGFYGHIGIRNLQDKALITILYGNRVHMHDLLQEMGRDIVRKECIKSPENRSRLCDSDEAYDVLIIDKGTDAIEGIMLDLSKIKDLSLKIDTLKKMTNLRFVKFFSSNYPSCKVDLPGSIELPSKKLSYLRWDKYPLPSLPTNFCVEKLVKLLMPGSNITKLWDGLQNVVNLKEINLLGCEQLMELPDFSKASKLERVCLDLCSNLGHIHPSLLQLDNLVELHVKDCEKLKSLQSDRHLKSLQIISIGGCSSLEKFSLSSEKIRELYFYGTAIETFPSSLRHCRNLKSLGITRSLMKIPELSKLTTLETLSIDRAAGIDLSELPILFDSLHRLRGFFVNQHGKFFHRPRKSRIFSTLTSLCLSGSSVESLPKSIKHLSFLEGLDVTNCQRLQSLPELSPSIKSLWARNCSNLETFIPSTTLEHCDLKNCMKLDEQSFSCIIAYVHYKIRQVEPTRVCLPGDRVLWWFTNRTMQTMISIELPPRSDLLGFVFGLYFCHEAISLDKWYHEIRMGCKCYLKYSDIEKFLIAECKERYKHGGKEFNSDDVYLWIYKCDSLLDSFNAISDTRASRLVSFQFFAYSGSFGNSELEHMIKGCGVWPIYASELESELGDNSKRICYELKSFEHQGIEVGHLDHENQDEQITQKLLRGFIFQPPSTGWKILNDNNEAFDFFKELELRGECKRLRCKGFRFEPEVDEQLQLSLTKKSKESTPPPVPVGLKLELTTKSYSYLEIEGIQVGSSDHENQDEQIPQKLLRDFIFQPLSTGCKMLNDNNEAFDFFKELELADESQRLRCKRIWCEPEVDEQLQLSLTKKSKESTLQPVPVGLELKLTTKSYSHLEIEGIQVGSSDHEKQDEQESLCTADKGIQGI